MVESLYAGDAWLMRGAFHKEFCRKMVSDTISWTRSREPSFHKMLDGVPDFHRMIDQETGKKYAFPQCKHSAYFFRWNSDPLGIWPEVTRVWRVVKQAMGLSPVEYENNIPSTGPVDRIQVVRYPPSIGGLVTHQDPFQDQRCFISGYLSKRGVDYEGGGFYFIGPDGKVDAESQFDVGDLCIGYATVMHGVDPCDIGKSPNWGGTDGRWFLGLYTNSPDTGARNVGREVKL